LQEVSRSADKREGEVDEAEVKPVKKGRMAKETVTGKKGNRAVKRVVEILRDGMLSFPSTLPSQYKFLQTASPPPGIRRSLRHRYRPLEWWRQERVVYGRPESGISFVPHIKEIIRVGVFVLIIILSPPIFHPLPHPH
jgi:centromere protein C